MPDWRAIFGDRLHFLPDGPDSESRACPDGMVGPIGPLSPMGSMGFLSFFLWFSFFSSSPALATVLVEPVSLLCSERLGGQITVYGLGEARGSYGVRCCSNIVFF